MEPAQSPKPPSSGIPNDPDIEHEKRKMAVKFIAEGIKEMKAEDNKFRVENAKLAKMDWNSIERNLTAWQIKIADILQQVQNMIPKGVKNIVKGVMCCCACLPRFCVASHVLCSVMYIGVGAVQLVAGIFFLISLPVFKVGSNVWTGVWNVVVGVGGAVFSSVGDLSPSKHRILLYLTITVLVLNLINLVVLELGEWRILMPDKVKATLQNHNLQTLVLYARMTTSISSALAVVIAFVDAQFMFCWLEHTLRPRHNPLDHKETVSDIEYIIPRAKSGSMGKNNPHNLYNQYQTAAAQSWVFDNTDTIGSTHSHSQMHAPTHARANSEHLPAPPHHHSPYGKLQQYTNASKTVVLRRKSNPSQSHNKLITDDDNRHRTSLKEQTMNGVVGMSDAAASSSRLQPVLLVEGISNDERHLQFMTSFSRTPSPVQPRSASSSPTGSDSNPAPIYECLERLTEPSVYRSRLNTALEASGGETQEQASPSVSPRAHSVAPRPHSVSPRPHSVALASDQQQYASLMVELERTIVAKFPAHEQQNSSRQSGQSGVDVAQCSDNDDATQHKQSNSDADFSRQLEAALQLIQDLESPNTVETPSDAPQLGFHQAAEMASTSANHNLAHNDRTRHLLESKSMEDRSSDDENTWSSDSHEALHKPSVYGKIQDPLTRGAAQLKRKHTTVIRISDGTEQDRVPRIDKRSVDNEETYKDSLESGRLSSFRPEKLGQTTNESRLRNTVGKCGTKEGESQHFSTGLWSSSSGGDPVGRSASFSNHYSVTRVPKVGENCVKAGETQQDRLASKQILEAETKPAYIINHCNDSGVMLDYSNSDESVDSGKDVVVVVNKNGGFVGNGSCVNGGVKECAVISEETDDDGVGANGGLKNGGIQNGALVTSTSSTSRSNSLKRSLSSVAKWRMFPKKRTARFVLTPELENTILKSESLLHLTDVELVARYDHNKSIQRKIEEKAWQKIIGASSTDSTC